MEFEGGGLFLFMTSAPWCVKRERWELLKGDRLWIWHIYNFSKGKKRKGSVFFWECFFFFSGLNPLAERHKWCIKTIRTDASPPPIFFFSCSSGELALEKGMVLELVYFFFLPRRSCSTPLLSKQPFRFRVGPIVKSLIHRVAPFSQRLFFCFAVFNLIFFIFCHGGFN